jgi:serine/threonine protein kinase
MTPERWQQVEDVLQAALDRPPPERAAYLEEACAGDEELKDEAAQLLTAHDEAGDFMERPAIAHDARVLIGGDEDVNVGRAIGPYRIIEPLGSGGMGEVYLAQDTRLARPVALKILHSFFASDDARLRRFQREARAASALNHPNILTIHDVGEADGIYFIATEFIDGQTLRELIAGEGLPAEEALDISIQVASALEAAHAAGIIHRDIKPENIMRRADRLVKILDFGIAKLTEGAPPESASEAPTVIKAQTEAGVVMGTVGYMSPEQARGLTVDERTDVWGLGCVLYEMLQGRAPFRRETRIDTLVAVLEREPAPLSQLTKGAPARLHQLQRVVSKALRKDRGERYRTMASMLADLKSASLETGLAPEDAGSSDDAPPPASSLARQETRHAERRIVQALIVIALLAAVVFFYSRSAARREENLGREAAATATTTKLYTQMSEAEKLAFINEQEQKISAQMGERPARLNDDALGAIKRHVDSYVARLGRAPSESGGDDLRVVYARPVPYLPLIARSFAARKVPIMVGIYLPMIESEYKPCSVSPIGARGVFQFLPQTARDYGVAYEEMCDMEKMTPAAAHYIADRMAELGDDAESMTLVLLSYNRGPEWVRDTLRQLRDSDAENYERNFWTLFVNRDKLDDTFRNENADYVPRFFAAAIVGENPQAFGLRTPPLTTLANGSAPAKP